MGGGGRSGGVARLRFVQDDGNLQIKRQNALAQSHFPGQLDVGCGTSNEYVEISGRHCPCVSLDVIVGKGSPIEFDAYILGFTRTEIDLRKAFEFLDRARNWSVRVANENLGNVGASATAGVGDVECDGNLIVRRCGRDGQVFVGE